MISSLFIYFINVLIIQITGSYISLIAEWLEGLLATKTWDGERAIIVLGDESRLHKLLHQTCCSFPFLKIMLHH